MPIKMKTSAFFIKSNLKTYYITINEYSYSLIYFQFYSFFSFCPESGLKVLVENMTTHSPHIEWYISFLMSTICMFSSAVQINYTLLRTCSQLHFIIGTTGIEPHPLYRYRFSASGFSSL